jgi:alanyl-tRNA synthetase
MYKYHDPFLFECEQTVKEVRNENDYLMIVLDDTIFYPGGGGQPHDTGVIVSDNFKGEVIEVSKKDDMIVHKINVISGEAKSGDKLTLKVNQTRRIKLIKMHSGEHILFKALETVLGEVKLVKIDLDEIESSLFIDTKDVTWDKLFIVEELTNKIINENRDMVSTIYSKEDAVKLGKLRIKPDRIKSDQVRVMEVEGFDWSACAGIHAPNSKYIGNLIITKFNFVKGKWEIRFKVDSIKDLFEISKTTRIATSILESEPSKVIDSIKKLQDDVEYYKKKYREIAAKLLDFNSEELISDKKLVFNIVEDVEKKQLVDKSNELAIDNNIVCFVNKSDDKAMILLNISKDLNINAPELLNQVLVKFNGKGGGRDSFAMGSCQVDEPHKIIDELKFQL